MPFTPLSEEDQVPEVSDLPIGSQVISSSKKNPFTESQSRAAGFTRRMIFSNSRMNKLEESGFDPVNMMTAKLFGLIKHIFQNLAKAQKLLH